MFLTGQQELPEDYADTAKEQFAQLDEANDLHPGEINESVQNVFKEDARFRDLASIF